VTADLDPAALDGYVPPPYVPPATLDERLAKAWREITRTPGRAALATIDVCAIAALAMSFRTIPVTTADAGGPLRAHCGVAFYVAGAPNHAVDAACRYAFASRVPALLLSGLVVVAVTALLVRSIARGDSPDQTSGVKRVWSQLTSTPGRAALATLDGAALLAVIAAAQPITVVTADAAGPLRAHCGLQYYVFGAANSAVGDSCRRAYGSRATFFVIALVLFVVATAALARLAAPSEPPP
jgi:hypothetical protein